MKSISLMSPGSVSIVEQEVDVSFKRMALLRVISSGICAADSYLWSGNHPWNISYPIVPGHEIFGEIIEVDSTIAFNFPIGSKVSVQVNIPCYVCPLCKAEKYNMCTERNHFGSTYKGSFAEKISIPFGARMHRYTSPINDLIGGLTETMANAIYCAKKVALKGDESVVILGMGSIGGCLCHYLMRAFPNLDLVVLTSSSFKREQLQRLGIKSVTLDELTRLENSFDIIFETSGFSENFKAGLFSLKPTGKAMIYSVFREEILFDFNQVSEFKELTLIGGHLASDEAFNESIEFLSFRQDELGYLISNIVDFSNFTSAFSSPKFSQFKTVFQPTKESELINGI